MRRWIFGSAAALSLGYLYLRSTQYGSFCVDCLMHRGNHHRISVERPAHTCLKFLCAAQHDFRTNDGDRNREEDFWRADIAGLYALAPGEGPAIKLVELSIAFADDRPVVDLRSYGVRSAKAGYWFRAIRHADEDPKALDPNRFAYCAFPDSPSAGKYIFIVDEKNTVFRAVADSRRGIEVFPTEEELKKSWSKLD